MSYRWLFIYPENLIEVVSLLYFFLFYFKQLYLYSRPLVSLGDWFQDPLQITKSTDAQFPYISV